MVVADGALVVNSIVAVAELPAPFRLSVWSLAQLVGVRQTICPEYAMTEGIIVTANSIASAVDKRATLAFITFTDVLNTDSWIYIQCALEAHECEFEIHVNYSPFSGPLTEISFNI